MKTIHTADFYFKAPSVEAFSGRGESATYIIEAVIKLPTAAFEAFRHNLLERQSCIADNVDLMYIDEAGTWHCIAIVAPDIVEPEKPNYNKINEFVTSVNERIVKGKINRYEIPRIR